MALYYVAHRLFAAHDRALGAYVAHQLARRFGPDAVFLPFCDTDEEHLIHPCKGRRLFELDLERLTRIDAMVALLHGPSLDDGVCMEIGYATARGVPVIAVTTDFQTYAPTADSQWRWMFPDPLLQHRTNQTISIQRLGPPGEADRFEVFLHQNLQAVAQAATKAISTLADPIARLPVLPPAAADGERLVYLEPSPYGNDGWADQIHDLLRTCGWTTYRATRLSPETAWDKDRTAADWRALERSSMAVVDIRGPETPPGAALIIGACAATGRPVYAPEPHQWWTFAHGREPNQRNLMIQYALSGTFTEPSELAEHLENR